MTEQKRMTHEQAEQAQLELDKQSFESQGASETSAVVVPATKEIETQTLPMAELALVPPDEAELPMLIPTDHQRALITNHFSEACPDWCVAFHFFRAHQMGLDPFSQMSVIPFGGKWTSTVNIHGLRGKASDTGELLGIKSTLATNMIDLRGTKIPEWGKCVVTRRTGGTPCEFEYVAYAEEWFKPSNNPKGDNWRTRPRHMLTIRAETHALHRAFPSLFKGIMETSEMQDHADTLNGVRQTAQMLETDEIRQLELALRQTLKLRDTAPDAVRRHQILELTMKRMLEEMNKHGRESSAYKSWLEKTILKVQQNELLAVREAKNASV